MKLFIVFALALAYASASVLHNLNTRNVFRPPNVGITRGHDAPPGQFPYQVRLDTRRGDKHYLCGGSLISNTWVLTAAHCIHDVDAVTVSLGSIDLFSAQVEHTVMPKDFIIHENFNSGTLKNDIALIPIPSVKFSKNIQPVQLPGDESASETYDGQQSIASGWGVTSDEGGRVAEILQYTDLMIMENSECQTSWDVDSSQICVSTPKGASTCFGDSGGPLVAYPSWVLVGVTSFGREYCEIGVPAVFTRVTSFLPWIKQHTGIST